MITGDVKDGGLGFDYKWNMGWMNDFLGYMQCDPYFRNQHYNELTFSMLYAYSEKFMLVFSHDEVVHGKGSMAGKMPGDTFEKKFANLRAAYGFMTGHPGKKLLFMGQDLRPDRRVEREPLSRVGASGISAPQPDEGICKGLKPALCEPSGPL